MSAQPEWVTLAELLRPRGVRGEIVSLDLSTGPERYRNLSRVVLFDAEGRRRGDHRVEQAWIHQDQLILKFEGIDDRDAAEALRGGQVRLPFAERAPLAEGEYYLSDLPGCTLVDLASGAPLGTVRQVLEMPAGPLLELASGALVPLTRELCPVIDTPGRVIRATLPEGLLDLNQN